MRIPTNQILTTLAPKTTPTTTTTKKTTTLRTTPRLTTAATRKTSAVLVPKKKKPTSSFDNDKDSNDGTNNSNDTIKACKYKKNPSADYSRRGTTSISNPRKLPLIYTLLQFRCISEFELEMSGFETQKVLPTLD